MRSMYDAAYAPTDPPDADVIVAGYIGGDAYHIWTAMEWASQHARYRLPIYVRSDPGSANPATDANDALSWMQSHSVPRGSAVALDYETAVDASYLLSFDARIVANGYKTLLYGSYSTVFSNPEPSGGYWDAAYTYVSHLSAGAVATQWTDQGGGGAWDESLVADSLILWDTQPVSQSTDQFLSRRSR